MSTDRGFQQKVDLPAIVGQYTMPPGSTTRSTAAPERRLDVARTRNRHRRSGDRAVHDRRINVEQVVDTRKDSDLLGGVPRPREVDIVPRCQLGINLIERA